MWSTWIDLGAEAGTNCPRLHPQYTHVSRSRAMTYHFSLSTTLLLRRPAILASLPFRPAASKRLRAYHEGGFDSVARRVFAGLYVEPISQSVIHSVEDALRPNSLPSLLVVSSGTPGTVENILITNLHKTTHKLLI